MVRSHEMPPSGSSLLGDPPGELTLRILNRQRAGQVVRIAGGKCSIGSAPTCTLRLESPHVHPLHCLILRGAQGAVIRRWHPDTRLNGRAFADALLTPGDRLSIGPVELEYLVEQSHHTSQSETSQRFAPATSRSGRRKLVRNLINQLRSARTRVSELEEKAARQGREAELVRQRLSQLESLLADSRRDRTALDASRREALQYADALQLSTEQLRVELAHTLAEFEFERQRWSGDRQRLEQELADRDRNYAHRQAVGLSAADVAQARLSREQRQWERERTELAGRLAEAQTRLGDFAEFQRKLAEAEKTVNHWRNEATALRTRADQLSRQLDDVRAEQVRWQEAQQEREVELARRSADLEARLQAFTAEQAELHAAAERRETELAAQRSLAAAAQLERDEFARQRAEMEREREALRSEQACAQAAWSEREQEFTVRGEVLRAEQTQHFAAAQQQLEAERRDLDRRISAWDEQQSARQRDWDQQRTAFESKQSSHGRLSEEQAALDRARTALAQERDQATAEIAAARAELAARENQLEALKTEQLAEAERLLAEQRTAWEQEQLAAREQLRRREEELTAARTELERKSAASEAETAVRRSALLANLKAEQQNSLEQAQQQLAAERRELAAERAAWDTERRRFEAELQVRSDALEQRSSQAVSASDPQLEQAHRELSRQQEFLASEKARWDEAQQHMDRVWSDRETKLARRQAEFDAAQARSLEQHRREAEELRDQLLREREAMYAEREQFVAELEAERSELERQRRELRDEAARHPRELEADAETPLPQAPAERNWRDERPWQAPADEPRSEPEYEPQSEEPAPAYSRSITPEEATAAVDSLIVSTPSRSDAPLSTLEVLARMGKTPNFDDEPAPSGLSSAKYQTAAAPAAKSPGREQPAARRGAEEPAEDDESIESYMNRLLQRVRGEASGGGSAAAQAPAYKPAAREQAPAVKAPPAPEPAPAAPAQPKVTAEEFVPRSQAPEISSNLAAMRDLANQTARSAISTSEVQRGVGAALGRAAVGVVALITAAGLVYLSGGAIFSAIFLAALGAGAVGLAFFGGAVRSLIVIKAGEGDVRKTQPPRENREPPQA